MQQLWFKAKTYGWGWTPANWRGWLVMVFYVLAMAAAAMVFLRHGINSARWIGYAVAVLSITGILIFICYKTGEKPRWS